MSRQALWLSAAGVIACLLVAGLALWSRRTPGERGGGPGPDAPRAGAPAPAAPAAAGVGARSRDVHPPAAASREAPDRAAGGEARTLDSIQLDLPDDLEPAYRTDSHAIWHGPKKQLTDVRGETLRLSNLVIDLSVSDETLDEAFTASAQVFGETLKITEHRALPAGWILAGEFVDAAGFDKRFVTVVNAELGVKCAADAFDAAEIARARASCLSLRAR